MFGIAWSELLLIGIVALVVVPPKDLPTMMRTVGKWIGQMRRMAYDFQHQVSSALREAEFEDLKKSVTDLTQIDELKDIDTHLNSIAAPLTQMEGQMRDDLSIGNTFDGSNAGNKSFAVDTSMYRASPLAELSSMEESTSGPGHVEMPGALTAALEPDAEQLDLDLAVKPVEVTRLPAHLRAPDPEPEAQVGAPVAPRDEPEPAKLSGASS